MLAKFLCVNVGVNPPDPILGAKVALYKDNMHIVSGMTNDEGIVIFDLPSDNYLAICSIPNRVDYFINNPWLVDLTSDSVFTIPFIFNASKEASAPYCHCYGYITDSFGNLVTQGTIRLTPVDVPNIISGSLVLYGINLVEIVDGYASVDLIRNGYYAVELPTIYRNTNYVIKVPNLPYANLADVLMPIPRMVVFDSQRITLYVGESKEVSFKVIYRSGLELSGVELMKQDKFTVVIGDSSIITCSGVQNNANFTVTGLAPGATTVTLKKSSTINQIYTWPSSNITGVLQVIVEE